MLKMLLLLLLAFLSLVDIFVNVFALDEVICKHWDTDTDTDTCTHYPEFTE